MTDIREHEEDQIIDQAVGDVEEDPFSWVKPKIEYPVRPWVRYWARQLDSYMLVFPIGILLALAAPIVQNLPGIALWIITFPMVAVIEALLLSTWGYTPGKWLLKVRVRAESGACLTFKEALKRSFSVIYYGMGLGIPIVSLITSVSSFERLKDNGITKWDEAGSFTVTHEKIGIVRIICFLAVSMIFGYLTAIGA